MKQDTPIRNISKVSKKPHKDMMYEVCLLHTAGDEKPEVVAKFRAYGDCLMYVNTLSKSPAYYHEILIRN